jgi:hypothetical protein
MQEKIPREIIVPVIAAVVLHAIAPNRTILEGAVRDSFAAADAFAEELRKRGMLV